MHITVAEFVKFLNSEQRDPRLNEILYPYYTSASAQRLIDLYEPDKELANKGMELLISQPDPRPIGQGNFLGSDRSKCKHRITC